MKLRIKLKKVILLLLASKVTLQAPYAPACTAFAQVNASGELIIGKNFDWIPSKGMIVQNPAGRVRYAMSDQREVWTSRYASLSFTPLGPGLPVSSMNEKGLVVEMLLDEDKTLPPSRTHSLVSFEWAQYVLDTFKSVDEVARFANSKGFDQILKTIHFFICDIKSNCIVVESAGKGIKVTKGKDLPVHVLANQAYAHDLAQSEDWLADLARGNIYLPYSSATRFWSLVKAVRQSGLKNSDEIFSVLNVSKIDPITQWQIIWRPREMSVIWREPSLVGSATEHTIALNPESCSQVTKVRYLSEPNRLVNYAPEDVVHLYEHLQAVSSLYGIPINAALAKRFATVALQAGCDISGR